jgi:glutamyl-tRNA synthetase
VIRLRNPNKVVTFDDIVLGEIKIDTTDLGDFVIAKDLESPLYHFTVVIDDGLMGITHILRGVEHVSNTPRQIVIQEAIEFKRLLYVHLPLINGKDGKKLSKRNGDVSFLNYRDRGFLPEAMENFLMLIGWNPGTDQEIFTREELINEFSLEKINKGSAVFNEEKLRWINKEHLKKYPDEVFLNEFKGRLSKKGITLSEGVVDRFLVEIRERIHMWGDIDTMIEEGEIDYLIREPKVDLAILPWKKSTLEEAQKNLGQVHQMLESYTGDFNVESLKELLYPYAEEKGKGDVLWPLRYALSGKEKSPDPFSLLSILGKEISLKRIQNAIEA